MIASSFNQFRADLDDYNDRKERLIKASRDITSISKRTIFLLHRIALEDKGDSALRAAVSGREKLQEIQHFYAGLRFEFEYVEALSFAYYLEHRTLITLKQAQETLCDVNGKPYLPLPTSDYLLGVSDLTGELMRFAISSVGRHDRRVKITEVCTFVRACKADLERMAPYVPDLFQKQAVTAQSLEKIESAAYGLALRDSESAILRERLGEVFAPSASSSVDGNQLKNGGGKATEEIEGATL